MRYLIYLRVSTEKQEDSGLGLDAQRHACHAWINKQPVSGETLEYVDIVSGTDKKRKELEQRPKLLQALSELQPRDVLLVAKRDRLGRDPYINCMIERIVEKKKAKFFSANGEMDGDEPHDILMRRIIDAFAEYEALMISTRTKQALARKKDRGERLGRIPYGQRMNSQGFLEVNPEEAEILHLMYGLRVHNKLTFREIADYLNESGIPNRPTKNRPFVPWTYGATARVYKNYLKIYEDAPALQATS